jgi:hypothetical protein
MAETLNECADPNPFKKDINLDPAAKYCEEDQLPTQKDVAFLESLLNQKTGIGQAANCDPMQTGKIVEDTRTVTDPNVINRYTKAFRGADEAMKDLFSNIVVIDEQGKAFPVPIQWASQERAVAMWLQSNVRKDNSLVVDRITLPFMAIYSSEFSFNQERYTYHGAINWLREVQSNKPTFTHQEKRPNDTVFGVTRGLPYDIGYQLTIWTLYWEDMNQILEQIAKKFSPVAYIRIQGVTWETVVKIQSLANNVDIEPGDQAIRVFKFQFTFLVETYLPQPIRRAKPVFKERIDYYVNAVNDEEVKEVLERFEVAIEGIEEC